MRITTPTTIWGFLLGQLLKLLTMTAAIIVVVLAFVGSVRMFANGTLGVVETLTLAGWLTVPMLQYALPFAGGFAATLAYHRMSQDNELTACYAGGVSHKTVLMPTVLLGLVLAVAMFAMADQVMPRFLRSAQEMITSDPSRLLASRLGKGQSMSLDGGRRLLYADDLSEVELEPGARAFKHLVLRGVVALEMDAQGNIERDVSSRLADVWLYHDADVPTLNSGTIKSPTERWAIPGESSTTAVMKLRDPVGSKKDFAMGTVEETVVSYRLPSTFRDNPKFLSWAELDRAWMNPLRMTIVEEERRRVAQMMAERTAIDTLREDLRRVGRTTLIDGAGRPVSIRAGGIEASPSDKGAGFALTAAKNGGSIEVTVVGAMGTDSGGQATRTSVHKAVRAYIGQPSAAAGAGTNLTLVMEEVSTSASGDASETPGVLSSLTISGLKPSMDPLSVYQAAPLESLQNQVNMRLAERADAPLERASKRLSGLIGETRREIRSKQNERLAASLSCFVMVLLGAVMGMRLGTAPPLTVYMWSFLPALVGQVAISGGQTMMVQHGQVGLTLLYGGVLAVGLFALVEYKLLARH